MRAPALTVSRSLPSRLALPARKQPARSSAVTHRSAPRNRTTPARERASSWSRRVAGGPDA